MGTLLEANMWNGHLTLRRRAGGLRGFTLIESLTVVGTLGILAVLGTAVVNKTMSSASMAREVNAAKQLVMALQSSAQDNNGRYLSGMDYRAGTPANPVPKPDGGQVLGHAAQRYPFRLAPYLGNQFEGTIFVNRNKAEITRMAGANGLMWDYYVSTFPALGMNAYCVGGIVRADGTLRFAQDCVSNVSKMRGSLLAFASGGFGAGAARTHGYCYVSPPTQADASPVCMKWNAPETWTSQQDPAYFGWVDFRYRGKAICAFLDGSVQQQSPKDLSDMRKWTPSAQDADDPHYELQP